MIWREVDARGWMIVGRMVYVWMYGCMVHKIRSNFGNPPSLRKEERKQIENNYPRSLSTTSTFSNLDEV